MKITDVETVILRQPRVLAAADTSQDVCLVFVRTDEGVTGIGEADSSPEVVRAVIEAPFSSSLCCGLRELVVGKDPLEAEQLWEVMYRGSIFYGRRGAAIQALSAIDIALWDIRGKVEGVAVSELFSPAAREAVECYASVLMPETAEAAYEMARRLREDGFASVKFGWGPIGKSEHSDVALVAAAREGLGNDVGLMLDVGFAWADAETALRRTIVLQRFGLTWIEEPLWPDDLDGYRVLASRSRIPIAAGEEETTRWGCSDLINRGAVHVVQPDLTRVGGFTEMRRIASIAREAGVRLVPHAWSSPLTQEATAQFLASAGQDGAPLEYQLPRSEFAKSVFTGVPEAVSGRVRVSRAPGLGVEMTEVATRRYGVS